MKGVAEKMCPGEESCFVVVAVFSARTQTFLDYDCALMRERQVSIRHFTKS